MEALTSLPEPLICGAIAILASFLMGFSRSGIGAGGFLVSPLMVVGLGAANGVGLVAMQMLVAGSISAWQHRRDVDRELCQPLFAGAAMGVVVGGGLLYALLHAGSYANFHLTLEKIVGGLSIVYVILLACRSRLVGNPTLRVPGAAKTTAVAGLVSLSQTVANSGTPLMTIFFLRCGMKKEEFVADQSIYLLVQNTLKLLPLALLGLIHFGNLTLFVYSVPIVLFGNWLGQLAFRTFSERVFFGLYIALLVIGLAASLTLLFGWNSDLVRVSG